MSDLILTISNRRGLHARASAKFVKCAAAFDAEITVARGNESVSATSVMGLMMLAASQGAEISVAATGPEAAAALAALTTLVNDKFGEE